MPQRKITTHSPLLPTSLREFTGFIMCICSHCLFIHEPTKDSLPSLCANPVDPGHFDNMHNSTTWRWLSWQAAKPDQGA